eukprot:77425_1
MAEVSRSDQEEFFARAVTDYYGAAADELDLKDGGIYTIIQTTENGWWFAVDFEHGIDGWVPSNYLEKVSVHEQSALRAEQKHQEEMEAQKHRKLAAAGAYDIAPDEELEHFEEDETEQEEGKGGIGKGVMFELLKRANDFRERADVKSLAANGDVNAKKKLEELEKTRTARKLQKAVNNPYKGRKQKQILKVMMFEDDSDITSSDDDMGKQHTSSEFNPKTIASYQQRRKGSRRPTMLEAMSAADIKYLVSAAPKFETVTQNKTANVDNYSSKSVELWEVNELLHYLTTNAKTQNTSKLKNALRNLCKKADMNETIRGDILKNNGLNIVLNILQYGEKNVAISISCCQVLQILCESPKCEQFPAEKVGVFYLCKVVRRFYKDAIFCYTAFNCIGNFVYRNRAHREYVLKDKYNKMLIGYIIEGMNKFRYNDQITQSSQCSKVQISGCLALENLAGSDEGRKVIGTDGVECVLDTFIAHMDNDNIIDATLRAMINLCINVENAGHFIQNGGLDYLSTYLRNHTEHEDGITNNIKITICRILRNISTEKTTANTLCEQDELIDVAASLLKNAQLAHGTEIFYETIQFISALITTLTTGGGGNKVLLGLAEKGLFIVLIDSLEMNYDLNPKNNKYITEINAQIAAIIYCYVVSKDEEIHGIIFNEEALSDADTFIPCKLIQPTLATPSKTLTYYTISTFFECISIADYGVLIKKALLSMGILDFLLVNDTWYKSNVDDRALAHGIAIILSYVQIWLMDHQQNGVGALQCDWDLNEYKKAIEELNTYVSSNKIRNTQSDQLKRTHKNLEKIVKVIPDVLKLFQS